MLIKTIILACAISVSLLVSPTKTDAEPKVIEPILTPEQTISLYALKYNASEKDLLNVAKCESKLNPKAINYNDGGKGKHSIGIFQFQQETFLTWEKKLGEDLDYYSYNDQAKLAAFMFSRGQQNQWSCYRIIKGV